MRIGAYSILGRYVQQPNEIRRRLVNYSRWLEEGERITAVTAAVDNATTPPFEITDIVIGPDLDRFAYYAAGGVSGEEYTVTFTVTTSAGQTREDEILFDVREIQRG
jgi:hypothetical protein